MQLNENNTPLFKVNVFNGTNLYTKVFILLFLKNLMEDI